MHDRSHTAPFSSFQLPFFTTSLAVALASASASAEIVLPYNQRTRAYSGYQATVRGDDQMVGMAGATVAIPDSVTALDTNPAGLTMTMGSVTAQINSNEASDRRLTGSEQIKVRSTQWGLTATPNKWGYAVAYYSPSYEGGHYISPVTGNAQHYEVSKKKLRLSVSRGMLKRKLSVGLGVELNRGIRRIGELSDDATGVSFQAGVLYHVKKHFLVGASFSPATEIGSNTGGGGAGELPGFARPIRSPALLNVGAGWIPNRYFSFGFSVIAVGTTEDTALLQDQSVTVGDRFTLQPRAGLSYILGEYKNLRISTAAGTYYEMSRTAGHSNRLHGTFSFQVKPWFVNAGIGVDRAEHYNNVFLSIGFDIVRTLRTFNIIPRDSVPPLNGFFPRPTRVSADGLPDGLTAGEYREFESPSVGDVKDIIENIPTNIENKFKGEPSVQEKEEARNPPKPKSKSRKGRAKKRLPEKEKSIFPSEAP
jgi:long-subunit fatty acid transport protein